MTGATRLIAVVLVLAVAAGVALRCNGLTRRAPFIDEAESAINALTILQRGVPVDHYLGLPIYENTLTKPWPGNQEYEFRDSSYSERGVAIYHGWLPLYAIAASCWALGVKPDPEPQGELRVVHSQAEIGRRVLAGRLPSILFSAAFLVVLFLAGRALYGADAGLAAACAAALSGECIDLGSQARYYSATLALATLAGLAVWRLRDHRRQRDWLFAALALAALFHTHMLACAIVVALLVPRAARAIASGPRTGVLLAMALLGALTVPWLVLTGYFEGPGGGPPTRELLELSDAWTYFAARLELVLFLAAAVGAAVALWALRRRMPPRASQAWHAAVPGIAFCAAWLALTYLGFLLFMPAASAFFWRLTLLILPAGLLLAGIATAAAVRSVLPRGNVLVAPLLLSLVLVAFGRAFERIARDDLETGILRELIDHLRTMEFSPGTRLYSLPNQHLVLQWTTGLPVQSIAPVRREFLERLPAEMVLLETADPWPRPRNEDVQRCADEAGETLTEQQVSDWSKRLRTRLRREDLAARTASVVPPLEAGLPAWTSCVLGVQRERREQGDYGIDFALHNPGMLRGTGARDFSSFWPVFYYRFVGPERRSDEHLNYATRVASAQVEVLGSGWAIYRCPPLEGR